MIRRLARGNAVVEFALVVAIALAIAYAVQAFVVKPYRIPSLSMVPTLQVGQRVLVDRLGNNFSTPHVGEIVVFHPPAGALPPQPICGDLNRKAGAACDLPTPKEAADQNFIKRVVAGPGDTIYIENGHVVRNGKVEADSYTAPCGAGFACNLRVPIKVPAGHWFMMGDNRGLSDDSRFWGPVPRSWIVGDAFFTYWPPGRIGVL